MAPIDFIWLIEPPTARYAASAVTDTWRELRLNFWFKPPLARDRVHLHRQHSTGFSDRFLGLSERSPAFFRFHDRASAGCWWCGDCACRSHLRLRLSVPTAPVATGIGHRASAVGSFGYLFYASLPAAVATPGAAAAAGFALLRARATPEARSEITLPRNSPNGGC
jgi:hypothetical protein